PSPAPPDSSATVHLCTPPPSPPFPSTPLLPSEAPAAPAAQRALTDAATAEIVRHSVAEELFVYPVYKRVISGGADEVEHDKEEQDRKSTRLDSSHVSISYGGF